MDGENMIDGFDPDCSVCAQFALPVTVLSMDRSWRTRVLIIGGMPMRPFHEIAPEFSPNKRPRSSSASWFHYEHKGTIETLMLVSEIRTSYRRTENHSFLRLQATMIDPAMFPKHEHSPALA